MAFGIVSEERLGQEIDGIRNALNTTLQKNNDIVTNYFKVTDAKILKISQDENNILVEVANSKQEIETCKKEIEDIKSLLIDLREVMQEIINSEENIPVQKVVEVPVTPVASLKAISEEIGAMGNIKSEYKGYCLHCRKFQGMANASLQKGKRGEYFRGQCIICGTTMRGSKNT